MARVDTPEFQIIYQTTVKSARLDIPTDPERCPLVLQRLLASCWDDQPSNRPSAEEMLIQLEAITQERMAGR